MSSVVPPLFSATLETSSAIELREPVNWTFALHVHPRRATLATAGPIMLDFAMGRTLAELKFLRRGASEAGLSLEGREPVDRTLTLAYERLVETHSALVSGECHAPVLGAIPFSHHVLRMASATGIRPEERLSVGRAMLRVEQPSKRTGHALARTKCHLTVNLTLTLRKLPKRSAPVATTSFEECEPMDRALIHAIIRCGTASKAGAIGKRGLTVHFTVSNCHLFSKSAASTLSRSEAREPMSRAFLHGEMRRKRALKTARLRED